MTTATMTQPRALTAYLGRATWGLPEHRRQELWDELEEHLLTRAEHLQLSGLSPTQALAQAIREMGPPTRVTLGMAKVYSMPKALLATGTIALGVSAGLYALVGGGNAPQITLPVLTTSPVKPTCVRGSKPTGENITVVSEKDGITCYTFNDIKTNSGWFVKQKDLASIFAQNGVIAHLSTSTLKGANTLSFEDGSTSVLWSKFTKNGGYYTDINYLLQSTVGTPVAQLMKLSNYSPPSLIWGRTKIKFDMLYSSDSGNRFYRDLIIQFMDLVLI